MNRRLAILLSCLLAWTAAPAGACPGCVAPEDGSGTGYLLATLLMGSLPLLLLAASLWFLHKLLRSQPAGDPTEPSPLERPTVTDLGVRS